MKRSDDGTTASIDSYVVGLAPTYWTHVPLLIEQVKSHLHVINGAQCFVLQAFHGENISLSQLTSSSLSKPHKLIPVSKCLLVGTIINAKRKSNGCIMYVLDDGTGLIDIVHYVDGDIYILPPLSEQNDPIDGSNIFKPGDVVRIFGRIQCKIVPIESNFSVVDKSSRMYRFVSATAVTREIHASLIVSIAIASTNHSHARPNSIDQECQHWMNCVNYLRSASECVGTSNLPLLNNSLDLFPLLGSDVVNQIIDRKFVLPSIASTNTNDSSAWRLFGTGCQCPNTIVKRDLLYCHCIATRLDTPTIDPNLRFRDSLLVKLLEAETAFASAVLPIPKSVETIWNDIINEVEDDELNSSHFQFQYSSIAADDELNQIAKEEISDQSGKHSSSLGHQSSQVTLRTVQELIRGTVRALRKDGIIYLMDADMDTYLLMSRTGVLEPYIRTKFALQKLSPESRSRYYDVSSPRNLYIKSVPKSRLEYVRRGVLAATSSKFDH